MPRYFFHVHDGADLPDPDGTELDGVLTARTHAVRYAAALLTEVGDAFWQGTDWSMDVTDERGMVLFTLHFIATEAAAVRGPPRSF